MIKINADEKLSNKEIEKIIKDYWNSVEYKRIKKYFMYYDVENKEIIQKFLDKKRRNKKPNNLVPTSYYATIVDSMAGYMFNNVQYQPETKQDEQFSIEFNKILKNNNVDIKDMNTGIRALSLNKGIELVYTEGNIDNTEIRFANINPLNMIVVYDDTIEPDVFAGIWIRESKEEDYDYYVDVIYNNEWQYYTMKNNELNLFKESRELLFSKNPICVYNTDVLNYKSPFDKIIPYINALDIVVTGNSNEIERLVDALLVIGRLLNEEDLQHMDEWKALMEIKSDERAEYLTKDMSPSFREYVTKLLIQEIHKHSHVIDWYSPDTGLSGAVSAKSLITRLFDMNMYSQRIEKIYKEGAEKRNSLIFEFMKIKGMGQGNIKIIYNRTVPSDFEDKINAMKGVDFLSKQTKVEQVGLDWNIEQKRIEEEQGDMEEINIEQDTGNGFTESETV
jgi:SPP1 family phage portal protein